MEGALNRCRRVCSQTREPLRCQMYSGKLNARERSQHDNLDRTMSCGPRAISPDSPRDDCTITIALSSSQKKREQHEKFSATSRFCMRVLIHISHSLLGRALRTGAHGIDRCQMTKGLDQSAQASECMQCRGDRIRIRAARTALFHC